jgi:putative tryptophan/tyrosine transport system substrate-binding protein
MRQVQRRQFLARSLALALVASAPVEAQPRTYRLVHLVTGGDASTKHLQSALSARLAELGYREGQNLVTERRFGDGRVERMPQLVAELLALKPDIFITTATPATLAAMKATRTIPIVFLGVADPVGSGIVKTLSHPEANVTGMSAQNVEIQQKRLQLLKESIPSILRVAVLYNPLNQPDLPSFERLSQAAKGLGLTLQTFEAKSELDFAPVFQAIDNRRFDAIYVLENALNFAHRVLIVELANSKRLPAIYGLSEFPEAGGLMAFSYPTVDNWRGGADYIDRIFRGAKPADLPVRQPTRFELVLNLKTAKSQGVTFPPEIVLRADRVIE